MFKNWLERRRTIKQMTTYMDVEQMREVLETEDFPRPKIVPVSFLLVQCSDEDIWRCEEIISVVHKIVRQEQGALVENIFSLLFYGFGIPLSRPDSDVACRRVADTLVELFPREVKVFIGHGDYAVGSYGLSDQMRFGVMVPGLSNHVETLLKSPPGQVVELKVNPMLGFKQD